MKTISKPKSPLIAPGRIPTIAKNEPPKRSYIAFGVAFLGLTVLVATVAFVVVRIREVIQKQQTTIDSKEDAYTSLAKKHVASLVGRGQDLSLDPVSSNEKFKEAVAFAESANVDDLGALHELHAIEKRELPASFSIRKIRSTSGTYYTSVDLVAEDQASRFIASLTRQDFDVFIGEKRLSPVVVEQVTLSTTRQAIAVLRDRSGSVGGEPDHRAALGIRSFVNAFAYPTVVRYWEFSDSIQSFTPWTIDPQIVLAALEGRGASGGTALYRSIRTVVADLATRNEQRVLIVFTDGNDSMNSEPIDDVIRKCNLAKVKVFLVALKSAELREDVLRRIATETGGKYFAAATPMEIEAHFRGLAQSLQQPAYRIIALHDPVSDSKVTVRIGNKSLIASD